MSGYSIVEEVMKRRGLTKENQVADALGKDRRILNNMKKRNGKPDADLLLDLMIYGNIEPNEAKALLKGEIGSAKVSLLGVTAMLCTLAMTPLLNSIHCILCKIQSVLTNSRQAQIARREIVTD